jgi:hypothetical protein
MDRLGPFLAVYGGFVLFGLGPLTSFEVCVK